MGERARPALPGELTRLVELCRQGLQELIGARGGAVFVAREAPAEPLEVTLGARLTDPDWLVLVGTSEESVLGYATVTTEVLRDSSRLGVIDGLFVEPGAREVGVGEALMDQIIMWCRDRGCAGVDATALPGQRETKNFFETFGFTARMLVVHHRLTR